LRKYAAARGWDAREFLDHGQSGRSDQREGLKALLECARRREVDAVAVVKLDRLGRSLVHLLGVLGELECLEVAFVSLDDGIDTQTAAGRLFMQIRGAFAEYEAGLIRERTLAGLEAARRRGKKCASATDEGRRS
jgi:DNA invertase Pin-like site-specific DNA recombinase